MVRSAPCASGGIISLLSGDGAVWPEPDALGEGEREHNGLRGLEVDRDVLVRLSGPRGPATSDQSDHVRPPQTTPDHARRCSDSRRGCCAERAVGSTAATSHPHDAAQHLADPSLRVVAGEVTPGRGEAEARGGSLEGLVEDEDDVASEGEAALDRDVERRIEEGLHHLQE